MHCFNFNFNFWFTGNNSNLPNTMPKTSMGTANKVFTRQCPTTVFPSPWQICGRKRLTRSVHSKPWNNWHWCKKLNKCKSTTVAWSITAHHLPPQITIIIRIRTARVVKPPKLNRFHPPNNNLPLPRHLKKRLLCHLAIMSTQLLYQTMRPKSKMISGLWIASSVTHFWAIWITLTYIWMIIGAMTNVVQFVDCWLIQNDSISSNI